MEEEVKKRNIIIILVTVISLFINLSIFAQADPDDTGPSDAPAQAQPRTQGSQATGGGDPDDTDDGGGASAQQSSSGDEEPIDIPQKSIKYKGEFFAESAMGLHSPNEFYRNAARLRLSIEARFLAVQFYGQIEFNYDTLRDNVVLDGNQITGAERYMRLRELYVEWESTSDRTLFSRFAIKAGRIIYNWGKGDEYRPSDVLNPQDYTNFMFTEMNDRKIPVWSINPQLTIHENFRIEFYFIPVHRGSELPGSGAVWENPVTRNASIQLAGMGVTNVNYQTVDKNLHNAAHGARAFIKAFGADFAISYFNGYDVKPHSVVNIPGSSMTLKYGRLRMYSLDCEFPLFGLVWRGEVAYFHKGKYYETAPTYTSVEKKYLAVIFGFDKMDLFTKGFYINIQYITDRIFKDEEDNIYARKTSHGISWDIYYEVLNGRWRFEVAGIWGITYKEALLKPMITWRPQNDFKVIAGAMILLGKGPNNIANIKAPLGVMNSKDFFYLQIEYSF